MKLTLRTLTQKILFTKELQGQFSDGHWENSGPRDHWHAWCGCDVEVGSDIGRDRGWVKKDNYNLLNRDLLEAVGDRMVKYGRLSKVVPEPLLSTVIDCLDLDGNIRTPPYTHGPVNWPQGFCDRVNKDLADESLYSMKDLKADLREIKAAMKKVKVTP